jgi:hypothetical protein
LALAPRSGQLVARSKRAAPRRRGGPAGLGQLSLVEHALCPLDPRSSLRANLVFDADYYFTDESRHRRTARATVLCPLGLASGDEFFLWGLLALTFAQPQPEPELHATPHYCLRQLGVIDQHARRGGRQYRQLADAVERLAAVTYRNDHFYDPVRAEHRRVSFGFLSYSLPLDPGSSRTWRFAWDPIFFEFVAAAGGHVWFDLATYRGLDPASRRLFLFVGKVFARRQTTPRMNVRHLGEHVLGLAPSLSTRDLKVKVARAVTRLAECLVVEPYAEPFAKHGTGDYSLTLTRGPYFTRKPGTPAKTSLRESPLFEPLRTIGFEASAAERLLRQHPPSLLREWVDITLAARERFGMAFFKRSPQAYFVDNVRQASVGRRTPPDWWHDLRKAERRAADTRALRPFMAPDPGDSLLEESPKLFERIRDELFGHFVAGGQAETDARRRAEKLARDEVRRKAAKPAGGFAKLGSLLRPPSS